MSPTDPLHATLVARFAQGKWRGALLRGPSGAGKSDLALRLIDSGWRLVADDRVLIWRSGGVLWGRAPDVLKGLLEIRGAGVLPLASLDFAEISAVFDCVDPTEPLERMPEPVVFEWDGVTAPLYRLCALRSSASEVVRALCDALNL